MASSGERITTILARLGEDREAAFGELVPLVYDELHQLARAVRRRTSPGATIETTALVHEAYLKLARHADGRYAHRGQFFAVAAVAMRQLLVDAARRRSRAKRGDGIVPEPLELEPAGAGPQAELVLAIDQALGRLERVDPRLRRVVECRFFAGLTEEETAEALEITSRTVRRDWLKAKGWLQLELGDASSMPV